MAIHGGAVVTHAVTVTGRGSVVLADTTTDQNGSPFSLTGLSGITYAGGNEFLAVMDNSNKVVRLNVTFAANGAINTSAVTGGVTVASSSDFEGIAYTNATRNSVFVSEETTPGVREYRLSDGALLQTVSTPSVFNSRVTNFGFESLTRGGGAMWTANEEALPGDGLLSTTSAGTVVRLQRFGVSGDTVTAGAQYAYNVNPIQRSVTDGPRDAADASRSGLSDLVALPDGTLLSLERSFAMAGISSEYQTRIYAINLAGATDVSGLPTLAGETYVAATKSLLWSDTTTALSLVLGGGIGNLEGLALGPQLANGNWAMLGIVDDGDGQSQNRLVAFEVAGVVVPEPSGAALVLAGAARLVLGRRHR